MHSEIPSPELIGRTVTDAAQSSTRRGPGIIGKLRFWWSWFVAGALVLILAPPILLVARLANKHDWVYPWQNLACQEGRCPHDIRGGAPKRCVAFQEQGRVEGKGAGRSLAGTNQKGDVPAGGDCLGFK